MPKKIEFLGLWEQINNPGFNPVEFDGIRKQAGLNSFILTAKQWTERTGAIGIQSKAGRYRRDCHAIRTAWPILQPPVAEISRPQDAAIAERLRLWAAESAQEAADDQAEGAG